MHPVAESVPGAPSVSRAPFVAAAYDASNVTFRVLRAFGWGPLLNLGYFPFATPLTLCNFVLTPLVFTPFLRLPAAQLNLVQRSMGLLDLRSARRVLDVGAGRGASSYMMANTFPDLHVTGIDLLPENVAAARTLYGNTPNLAHHEGDAMHLDFPDRSFDRVLCLEAAFHFPHRAGFLRELARVVDTPARVVIVDFMWKNDEARHLCNNEQSRLVQRTWQWDSLDSVREYQDNARANGFEIEGCLDWSPHVTAPLRTIFESVARLAKRTWGRALLVWYNPLLRALNDDDWQAFIRSAGAHQYIHRFTQYTALVLKR